MALLVAPIILSSAGAFAIFRTTFAAIQKQIEAREAARRKYLADLERSYQAVMFALVAALDSRDHLARGHSRRVVGYALAIGDRMGLGQTERRELAFGGYLHDVGKIGINDALLRKKSRLSTKDWVEIRRHPVIGHEILHQADFLGGASDVVLYHHERFDGSGYPTGLSGREIPLLARIFAVADSFDAMTADRPYRRAQAFAAAIKEIESEAGRQFCPDCVRVFLSIGEEQLRAVRREAEASKNENFWQTWHLTEHGSEDSQ